MVINYFNVSPKNFGLNRVLKKEIFGHYVLSSKKQTSITPIQITNKNISPENILALKDKYKIELVRVFDRIIGNENTIIIDHINRSGVTFLTAKTPHKKLPMFPDMSNIYVNNGDGKCVHTIGPKQFRKPPTENNIIFSEATALTSVVWHYIGVRVRCFGISDNRLIKDFL